MIYNTIRQMVKEAKSPELPVIIPTFNNPTYMCNMIEQLRMFGFEYQDIIILDNFSKSPIMQEMLNHAAKKFGCHVVKKFTNDGPREYYKNKDLFNWLPEKFILTDPDIGINPNIPHNFVEILSDVSEQYSMYKVGFALDIEMENLKGNSNIKDIMFAQNVTMYQWEKQFYANQIGFTKTADPIYLAAIDTTFCLVNKKFFTPYDAPMQVKDRCVRIGGNFTAQHYGWYYQPPMTKDEYNYYLSQVSPQWSFSSNEMKRRLEL